MTPFDTITSRALALQRTMPMLLAEAGVDKHWASDLRRRPHAVMSQHVFGLLEAKLDELERERV